MASPQPTTDDLHALFEEPWFSYLTNPMRMLILMSVELYEHESQSDHEFADYSYIVFSMAKAYEGFIKKYLYDLNLISREIYEGHRFSVGRSLNPDVSPKHKDEFWHYDDLEQNCGPQVARKIWEVYLECRNRTFHYYPKNERQLTLTQAHSHLEMMAEVMAEAVSCNTERLPTSNEKTT